VLPAREAGAGRGSRVIEYGDCFLIQGLSHSIVGYLEKNFHQPGSREVIKCWLTVISFQIGFSDVKGGGRVQFVFQEETD
jgi:hypothetical protein